jgi:DUF4097 and DUF4098 domain-containing protein YvlB
MSRLGPLAFAAIFAIVTAAPVAAQRETETVDRTLTVQSGTTVRLKTFSGRVTITAGGAGQVVIRAVRRATRERLDDIKLDIQQSGNEIVIDANHRLVERRNENVVETDFDIQVPPQTPLNITTFSAPVDVTGVSGRLTVEGFSSDVRLTNVAGPTQVKTFSGGVTLRAAQWSEGDDLHINTFSGDVTVQLPDRARGDLEFDSFSGTFDSALPVTMQTSSRRNFRGQLNGGGSTAFRLKTFSGSVTIRR